MDLESGCGTILIVAGQRDARRLLFNAFDGHFEAIYSARDIPQARSLLKSVGRVDLLLIEFPADARRAREFCEELGRDSLHTQVPVIGIIESTTPPLGWAMPVAVREWITGPIDPVAVLDRINAVLRPRAAVARTVAPVAAVVGNRRHRDVVDDVVRQATPTRTGSVRSVATGPGASPRSGNAPARADGSVGDERHALTMLARLPRASGSAGGFDAALGAVAEWLDLDFALLAQARPGKVGEIQSLGAWPADAVDHGFDPLLHPILKRVLDGTEIVKPGDPARARRKTGSAGGHRFECVIGLPLADEHGVGLGALLIGRRDPIAGDAGVLDGLRAVAVRFAMEIELRRAREQGRARGLQDALTGLPNRLLFNDRLASILQEAHRSGEMFAVVFADLDRFKNINDSLGHAVGDQVLVAMAKRLRAGLRASDTLARYAGDEFTMILRHVVQREDVLRVAEKIVRMMEAPLLLSGERDLHVTASLGISFHPQDAASAERLLKQADIAMYNAKRMGRNNFQAYVAGPEEAHQQRLALETKLHMAERNGELRVYYQPQVDAASEDIIGMEALVRWEHPDLGMISPGFFIPLAEASGLIMPIGEWVLRAACADARRWHQRFGLPLRLGVNLSPLQLRQPGLVKLIADVLSETALESTLLDLEMTESMSMNSIPHLQETLQALRELGCSISIDDFGTGQSSLDYLKRFPADRIKIDQSFVRNIGVDPDDEAIVRATISMAHNLNREVVAEGVETEEHLDFLRVQDCDVLQGYLFCRPLPSADFEKLLAQRARLCDSMNRPAAPA
ncbi:MAG TPA: bifunctional diguanylate cyclase/phosphodiesterase [Rhodanobacteraceae bacterium]|nr:bifunctional diguanylate cyclase/phosphodiesterase [Rhodanobacteraceae bacterium]